MNFHSYVDGKIQFRIINAGRSTLIEDMKKLENNQIEAVSGGTFVLDPNKPYCFKCKSQHVRTEVLRTSPGDPTTLMMTCRDCGNFWYTTDRNGKK